jgi:hypothetical protein
LTPVLVLLAALVVAGAVAAVAAATPRAAVLGLLVAMAGAAYIADPLPGPIGLAARLAGTTLAAYLVWIALRRAPRALPPATAGWLGSGAIAAAAFVAGWLAASGLGEALGPTPEALPGAALAAGSPVARAALAAALALAAVSLPQVAIPRDTLRLGTGCLLLLAAAGLAGNALVGRLDAVVELSVAVLTAVAGAAVGAVIAASVHFGGDLVIHDALRPDAAVRHRAADDAHPGPAEPDRTAR